MNFLRTKQVLIRMGNRSDICHSLTNEERILLHAHYRTMYKEVEKVCDKHGLTMMLTCGSLLGAVRHHGIIPWDDDMDLLMPRRDYDLFVRKYAKELPDNFLVDGPNGRNELVANFVKVIDLNTRFLSIGSKDVSTNGIYLDIFPLENISSNKAANFFKHFVHSTLHYIGGSVRLYEYKTKEYKDFMCTTWESKMNYWLRLGIGFIFSFIPHKKWRRMIDKWIQHKQYTGYFHSPLGDERLWIPNKEELYFPVKKTKFDDINVYIPNQAIALLEQFYGNWQKIPSPEERWEHKIKKIVFNVKMKETKTALIIAAGLGTRFGEKTELKPKGFVTFNGIPMVERSIQTLIDCGINRIIVGTGYHKEYYEALTNKYSGVECVFSPRFAETNSMYTLWNCRKAIGDDNFLLLESDLVFEKKAIDCLLECPFESAMLITPVTKFQDQYYVQMNDKCELVNCSVNQEELAVSGEMVGIHKISNSFYKILCSEYEKIVNEKPKLGYEFQLLDVSQKVTPMHVLKQNDLQWYEIDDEKDLKYAEKNIKIQ